MPQAHLDVPAQLDSYNISNNSDLIILPQCYESPDLFLDPPEPVISEQLETSTTIAESLDKSYDLPPKTSTLDHSHSTLSKEKQHNDRPSFCNFSHIFAIDLFKRCSFKSAGWPSHTISSKW